MGANNADFKSSVLYHGTTHPFEVGDIVEPRNGNPAYATPNLEYATEHADKREDHEYNKVAASGRTEDHARAAGITGRVFEVAPIDTAEETGSGDDKGNVLSQVGFRVVKRIK